MCLQAVRYRSAWYRFNSITCFFFMRRFRSHGTTDAAAAPPCRIGWSHFFPSVARSYTHALSSDQVGLVAVKVLCFTTRSHVLPMAARSPNRRSPTSYAASLYARGKGEIFESDDEPFRASEPHNVFIASRCIAKIRN